MHPLRHSEVRILRICRLNLYLIRGSQGHVVCFDGAVRQRGTILQVLGVESAREGYKSDILALS